MAEEVSTESLSTEMESTANSIADDSSTYDDLDDTGTDGSDSADNYNAPPTITVDDIKNYLTSRSLSSNKGRLRVLASDIDDNSENDDNNINSYELSGSKGLQLAMYKILLYVMYHMQYGATATTEQDDDIDTTGMSQTAIARMNAQKEKQKKQSEIDRKKSAIKSAKKFAGLAAPLLSELLYQYISKAKVEINSNSLYVITGYNVSTKKNITKSVYGSITGKLS